LKTDELIALLASGAAVESGPSVIRRVGIATAVGFTAAVALTLVLLGLNPALARTAGAAGFWVKEAYCLSLAVAGVLAALRLSRPGARLRRVPFVVSAIVVAMALYAARQLSGAPPAERLGLVLGQSARVCSLRIALLASPVFVALLIAVRGLAPTRLRFAGGAAGFASGALGALAYSLHCPEVAAPFVATWYLLGIALPALAGALLGPRILRW